MINFIIEFAENGQIMNTDCIFPGFSTFQNSYASFNFFTLKIVENKLVYETRA